MKTEFCVASDRSRVANILLPSSEYSTEHLKHFNYNVGHGPKLHLRTGPRPVLPHSSCQRCTRAIPSSYPTILAPAMTPISLAQCPILYCNFRMIMHQVQTRQSQPLPRKHTRSRKGGRTALITTRQLSLPSVDVFPHLVRQREKVFILFLLGNRNPMVLNAIHFSITPQHANAVSSASGSLDRLSRNGHSMNMRGKSPTKKSRLF